MLFLKYSEAFVSIFIILFVISQVIIPLWKGTPMYPFFRIKISPKTQAEKEFDKLQEEKETAELRVRSEKRKQDIKKLNQKISGN